MGRLSMANIEITAFEPENTDFSSFEGKDGPWYLTGYFWKTSGLSALLGVLLLAAGLMFWHYVEGTRQNEQTARRLAVNASHLATDIQQWYETAIQAVNMAVLHPAILAFKTHPDDTIDYFEKLADEVPRFSQLRIILPDGMETLRVDASGRDSVIVPKADLQDKSGRYYVQAAKALRPGEVYVSVLDLNVENGAIEVPFRPTSRLVTPVAGSDGAVLGYLIVNIDMAQPLGGFVTVSESDIRSELLNQDGYWLAGVERERLWGFMRDETQTMARTNPDLWQRISDVQGQEFLRSDGRIYEIETLSITDVMHEVSGSAVQSAESKFYLVASARLYQAWGNIGGPGFFVIFVFGLAIFGVSGGIGYLLLRRRQALHIQARLTKDLMYQRKMASLGRIVAGVSHEMRTPLGNALTVSTTMSDDIDDLTTRVSELGIQDEDLMDLGDTLRQGSRILQKNIDRTAELLKHFSQTASDQTIHKRGQFDLVQIIENLIGTLEKPLDKSGVRLEASLPASAKMVGYSDAVDQVLLNLIMNARQHAFVGCEGGQISIRLSEHDKDHYLIEVADDGVGIAPEYRERIFEPFWSLDRGPHGSSTHGSGLGLAITLNTVQSTLGGKMTLSSAPGKGTIFQIILPKVGQKNDPEADSPFNVEEQQD
ncbi:sensor histidine kinase [Thalassospira tepidiphila]|jgi:two-component system, NtrC family, sensor kinase|nr:sensor histidine kinase [Thalassospira tepidiphila]